MVTAVRSGRSQRSVAREHGVSLRTVQRWLVRAGDERLDRVDLGDRSHAPLLRFRTEPALEDLVLDLRRELRDKSVLGEYGAAAIRFELLARGRLAGPVPSLRTIGRILERRGALDARRVRRPAPPAGWYLPDVTAGHVELDSFDVIEGLRLRGGRPVDVLTAVSLHGGLAGAWPDSVITAQKVVGALAGHWSAFGLPAYAQFDNDTRFSGPHADPDVFGSVVRLCLGLGVTPVFVTPHEVGFQAAVESFNGRWQGKLWGRFWSETIDDVKAQSTAWIAALRTRHVVRIEGAPARRPFPADWLFEPDRVPPGRLVYLRRTDDEGVARLLGHTYRVDPHWPHRLVRAELDLAAATVRFFALRRRDPTDQPLLRVIPYTPLPRGRRSRLPSGGTVDRRPIE